MNHYPILEYQRADQVEGKLAKSNTRFFEVGVSP